MDLLKREERLENVERIARANEYSAQKVKQKIEYDQIKGEQLQQEKQMMLETRLAVRKQAEMQKRAMLINVEKLKKKGALTKADLGKLGLGGEEAPE